MSELKFNPSLSKLGNQRKGVFLKPHSQLLTELEKKPRSSKPQARVPLRWTHTHTHTHTL